MANSISLAAFGAVRDSEVSGLQSKANKITPPNPNRAANGNGGWTIGSLQSDFNTNASQATATLSTALVASGVFDAKAATLIASSLTNAKSSAALNLSGITAISGSAATIQSINAALATPAGSAAIASSDQTIFDQKFSQLQSDIFNNTGVLKSVQGALADPTYGAVIKVALADYNNQYGVVPGGPMMDLLTKGSGTQPNTNVKVVLDTSSAKTIAQGVLEFMLDTKWVGTNNGTTNGGAACSRIANDLTQAALYDTSTNAAARKQQRRQHYRKQRRDCHGQR